VRAPLKVAAIFAACAAPLLFGWLVYEQRWISGPSANYGELITPPRALGGPFALVRGKWVLVTFDGAGNCAAACERKLYIVRQVRRAQGENAERVARLWIVTDGGRPSPALVAAIEGTEFGDADAELERAFPGPLLESIYLVDPRGNLMMRFPGAPDPTRMIRDLERLLKYSSIG
jgi:cytochrome oxidase Cu insertion factor (SCO1/SenC/PrrC family)